MDFPHETCSNFIDSFCVVCCSYVKVNLRKQATFIEDAYLFAFEKALPKGFWWIPKTCCLKCASFLYKWKSGTLKYLPFDVPAAWTEPDSPLSCFFCQNLPTVKRTKPQPLILTQPERQYSVALPRTKAACWSTAIVKSKKLLCPPNWSHSEKLNSQSACTTLKICHHQNAFVCQRKGE